MGPMMSPHSHPQICAQPLLGELLPWHRQCGRLQPAHLRHVEPNYSLPYMAPFMLFPCQMRDSTVQRRTLVLCPDGERCPALPSRCCGPTLPSVPHLSRTLGGTSSSCTPCTLTCDLVWVSLGPHRVYGTSSTFARRAASATACPILPVQLQQQRQQRQQHPDVILHHEASLRLC